MDRLNGLGWVVSLGWLWAFLPLLAASSGLIDLLELMGLFLTSLLAGAAWLGSCVWVRSLRGWSRWVWFSVPAIWVVAMLISATDLPLATRLWLSERAVREHAEGYDPDPPRYKNKTRIGLFVVEKVWRHERTVAFVTDAKPFIRTGVAYAPDGLPTAPLPMEVEELLWARFTHLYGPWYRFEIGD